MQDFLNFKYESPLKTPFFQFHPPYRVLWRGCFLKKTTFRGGLRYRILDLIFYKRSFSPVPSSPSLSLILLALLLDMSGQVVLIHRDWYNIHIGTLAHWHIGTLAYWHIIHIGTFNSSSLPVPTSQKIGTSCRDHQINLLPPID